jgi:excisionase family DNA binding protein
MISHTLHEVAEALGVGIDTVARWVSAGELRAVNVSRNRASQKPRLRVLESDLQAFLAGRATGGNVTAQRRARPLGEVREYV